MIKIVTDFESFRQDRLLESYEHLKNYMFFSNLETIKRKIDQILSKDFKEIDTILDEHDWAGNHVAVATENINQVCDFLSSADHSKEEPVAEPAAEGEPTPEPTPEPEPEPEPEGGEEKKDEE